MNTRNFSALLALAGLLPLAPSAFAAEAFDNCTGFIDSLPATLSTQGTWCLRKDVATGMSTGNAITVNAPNITIDCNGYKVGGLAAGLGTEAVGIYASERSNTVIRNCNVRGFSVGAYVIGSAALVEDNRLEGSTVTGVVVGGSGSMVRRNTVVATGGSTVHADAYGILVQEDVDVLDNTIDTVIPREGGLGEGTALFVMQANGASIVGNRIRNVFSDGGETAYGIQAQGNTRLTIADNQVVGPGNGVGIVCTTADNTAKGNTVAAFQTAISGCDNITGTNLVVD